MQAKNEAEQIASLYKLPLREAIQSLLNELRAVIRLAATLSKKHCFFAVPAMCIEIPINYNQSKMTRTLVKLIRLENYKCSYRNCVIHVWWGDYE